MPESAVRPATPVLHKKLGVRDLWGLGVGIVVCGQYFGWNLGLEGNGPPAMLVASLLVCLLFLCWVLTLAELSVAMPHAGGPLAYGERAGGPWLGFTMAWSMLLECTFGMIATALASGWYVTVLFPMDDPDQKSLMVVAVGLTTVAVFFVLQAWGVSEQSTALVWMTYAAILGLIMYWGISATNFSAERIWTTPVLGDKGWRGVVDAAPYALWWLIIIEGVALAAEETAEPHRTIPRGLVLSMLTVIGLIAFTLVLGCAAMDSEKITGDYPLAKVVEHVNAGRSPALEYAFGAIAMFGLIASYHGLLYGTSRQLFALGRAGYLPAVLGQVHAGRRTPILALLVCSVIAAAFLIASVRFKDSIEKAILVAGLASLIWYILAMFCLWKLRGCLPGLFTRYRAPLVKTLPCVVIVISAFALLGYAGKSEVVFVLALSAILYLTALSEVS
jgi:ethanolamine permease